MKRIATAAVLIPTISYFVLFAEFWQFAAGLSIIASLCYYEYLSIARNHGIALEPPWAGYLLGLAVLNLPAPEIWLVVSSLVFMALALRSKDLAQALPHGAVGALGILYVYGAWRTGIDLRAANPWWLFFACALNWIGDTAAFYIGRTFGRNKLAPRVSPAKSWEGAIASVIASMLLAAFLMPRLLPDVPAWKIVVIGAGANVFGQLGDLCESALKRGAGMKDSSNLLPGHGGWLDRVDSSLFAMPAVYLIKSWLAA